MSTRVILRPPRLEIKTKENDERSGSIAQSTQATLEARLRYSMKALDWDGFTRGESTPVVEYSGISEHESRLKRISGT